MNEYHAAAAPPRGIAGPRLSNSGGLLDRLSRKQRGQEPLSASHSVVSAASFSYLEEHDEKERTLGGSSSSFVSRQSVSSSYLRNQQPQQQSSPFEDNEIVMLREAYKKVRSPPSKGATVAEAGNTRLHQQQQKRCQQQQQQQGRLPGSSRSSVDGEIQEPTDRGINHRDRGADSASSASTATGSQETPSRRSLIAASSSSSSNTPFDEIPVAVAAIGGEPPPFEALLQRALQEAEISSRDTPSPPRIEQQQQQQQHQSRPFLRKGANLQAWRAPAVWGRRPAAAASKAATAATTPTAASEGKAMTSGFSW